MLITGTNQNVLALQCEQLKCRDVFGRSFPNSMDFTNEYKSHNSNNQDSCFQASGIGHVTQRLKPATKRPKPNVKQGLSALSLGRRLNPYQTQRRLKFVAWPGQCAQKKLVNCLSLSLSLCWAKKEMFLKTGQRTKNRWIRNLFIEMVQIPPDLKENEHDNGKNHNHLKMSPIENDDIPWSC